MYGKLLSRQVRRAFGAGDPAAFLEALSAQANSCPPEVGDCLRALPDFMRMVATNGHRLAKMDVAVTGHGAQATVFSPLACPATKNCRTFLPT